MFAQECIPVLCVPTARRPYAGVCFPGGGGGVSGRGGGGVPGPGGFCLSVLWDTTIPPCEQNDKQV